jgi:hypothetical protein
MADQVLTFHSWTRERLADLATGAGAGRARGQVAVTLTGRDAGGAVTRTETRQVAFLLAGPADVVGVQPAAIIRRHPSPGAVDHETDRCPHVEFGDPALPWRYSPAGNPGPAGQLGPWLALVVGIEGDELVLAGDRVTLSPAVQALHELRADGRSPFAHVQTDGSGRRLARVLSTRPLEAGADYLAVLVASCTPAGAPAWTGAAAVTVPAYDHWRFRTATPPGSFEDLAARLKPGQADPTTGRAPVDYPRVPLPTDLEVRGALAPLGEGDLPLPPEVATDLQGLRTPARDEAGRPIVGLPRYGDAWTADPDLTSWGATLNGDPRHRGVAGVGLELGIRLQEELAAEAAEHLGALAEARQRIRDLALGHAAAGRLWERRLPSDPLRRLWVLGPALGRVVTERGTVAAEATAPGRALPAGVFSSAARRALRGGPARTAALRAGRVDPAEALHAANRCPEPPPRTDDGVVLEGMDDFDELLDRALEAGRVELDRRPLSEMARRLAETRRPELLELARHLPELEDADALALLGEIVVGKRPEEPPCRPVSLDDLAAGVTPLLDPRGHAAPAVIRVIGAIGGLDAARPLAPPEVCVGLDRPVWRDVEGAFPEWLLPGVGRLLEDTVIAVETNPAFVDALLTGLNSQLLSELRWRNIPVATGCTPLRAFWQRADTASGDRVDDVVGLHAWDAGSDLGDAQHRPPGAAGRDLVVVTRGQLFLRYPATIVYLQSARHAGAVDFSRSPADDAVRILPTFQGRIGRDVTFFGFQGVLPEAIAENWVVFEEPPAGFRFANDRVPRPIALDGAGFADAAFADPVRVLLQGDVLDPGP